jgi:hypothetical protein
MYLTPRGRVFCLVSLLLCTQLLLQFVRAVPEDSSSIAMGPPINLLLNSTLGFHCFENSRKGENATFRSGAVACWDQDAYGDCEAYRASRVPVFRPLIPVDNVVVIHPGKLFSQFILMSEAGLDPGDRVSLSVFGYQAMQQGLRATVFLMQVDGAAGQWSPADFGQSDGRTFAKCARGEMIPVPAASATTANVGHFELKLENVEIVGALAERPPLDAAQEQCRPTTIGLTVELANVSQSDVWIYSPCLSRSPQALNRLPDAQPVPSSYRHIPRTVQKLWRGEPLHILHLGYSSDCGDANPRLYLYDENPKSATFKQPLELEFNGVRIGHPDWNDYFFRWNFYFMAWGRMRCSLFRKFDYSIDRILLNSMARGGSYLSEAHSAYADYASLSVPPGPANGHREGKTWTQLYPALFGRLGGPSPDLVTIGYGKKTTLDNVDEIEQYEGTIRWFQRHYPGVEFVFTVNDWREGFADNAGGLEELSLRYGIPFVDFGRALNLTTRHYDGRSPILGDRHPQAYAHYIWYKQIEKLFEVVDPIQPGFPQAYLPERISPDTIGWEGDIVTYGNPHSRLRLSTGFIFDDTTVNLWATCKDKWVQVMVDGTKPRNFERPSATKRDIQNSTYAVGRLSLGDRHIVEVVGTEAHLIAVDAKTALNRQWLGVENRGWALGRLKPKPFQSQWGSPYGYYQLQIPEGKSAEVEAVGTFFSVAYVDQAGGGTLLTQVDGSDRLRQPTNVAFRMASGEALMMENRRGIGPVPYGLHVLRVTAVGSPVALLGIFAYDTRSNRSNERVICGTAFPGETVSFNPHFNARPLVLCTGGLRALTPDTTLEQVRLTGNSPGRYQIIGE